jgi:hypothetical protein
MQYLKTNAATIVQLSRDFLDDPGKILLILGLSRSQDYFMMTYSSESRKEFNFNISIGDGSRGSLVPGASGSLTGEWERDPTVFKSIGPERPEPTLSPCDAAVVLSSPNIFRQSVFIWTCVMQKRSSFRLRAAAGPHSPNLGESDDDGYDVSISGAETREMGQKQIISVRPPMISVCSLLLLIYAGAQAPTAKEHILAYIFDV